MGKEITKTTEYKILKTDPQRRKEIISENMGALGVSAADLDRVKMPSGGSLMKYMVPTLTGEEAADTIQGIIVGLHDVRVYWAQSIDEGGSGNPPDCYSDDCVTGHGRPAGSCATCPMAEFGTAQKGTGQACSQRRILFLMRKESNLPIVINLPPTSLANARKFFLRMVDADAPYYGVIVEIGLDQDKNASGVDYAKATFKVVEKLSDDVTAQFRKVRDEFAPYLSCVAMTAALVDPETKEPL